MRGWTAALVIGFALVATSAAGAAQPLVSDASSGAAELGGPYCGLYAVYAAARLNGLEARENGIEDLLKPEYIGSCGRFSFRTSRCGRRLGNGGTHRNGADAA